jgi:hypothetical protein
VRAGQPYESVTEIFALKQNEDHEDNDDARGRERMKQGRDQRSQALQRARVGLTHFDLNG